MEDGPGPTLTFHSRSVEVGMLGMAVPEFLAECNLLEYFLYHEPFLDRIPNGAADERRSE